MSGILRVEPWGGARGRSSVVLGERATLHLNGDFTIGHNVHVSVAPGAVLSVDGVKNSTGSGITCDARVMVAADIRIGADTIIAWGVVVTDSDWHEVNGIVHQAPVEIGAHVWISHDCSILRGAVIPDGCVVAAKSIVTRPYEESKALIAGAPAKIVRRNIEWTR